MLKSFFIILVRPYQGFSNVVWPPKLIQDRKLIEGVKKKKKDKKKKATN